MQGKSLNGLIVDSLAAEVERVRSDKDFTKRGRVLIERDKELLERLAKWRGTSRSPNTSGSAALVMFIDLKRRLVETRPAKCRSESDHRARTNEFLGLVKSRRPSSAAGLYSVRMTDVRTVPRLRRNVSILVFGIAVSTATALALSASAFITAQPSAAAPTFSVTLAGTDAHSLDPHVGALFAPGGGVQPVSVGSPVTADAQYFELAFNLPVGATVTSLAVSYQHCKTVGTTAVFGSYEPATLSTVQVASLTLPAACGVHTVTKKGALATVAAGRRYVVDYHSNNVDSYGSSQTNVLYGATLKYTCTSPCVP